MSSEREIKIVVGDDEVSGLLIAPPNARACYVVAHGSAKGMRHHFFKTLADRLAEHEVASLRFQFPYMEYGRDRRDSTQVAQATLRAAVAEARRLVPNLLLIAGGKSFGAQVTAEAQAESPLEGVRGLIFLGFPLHSPKRPSAERAGPLFNVDLPMLFLQGERDKFASPDHLRPLVDQLKPRATLKLFADADHSFHVPAISGRTEDQVMNDLLNTLVAWVEAEIVQ
ncbi:MAG TPA: alpha/beta family hydrolase [Rhizomicrobium sp.]|jgi:hypothetical protein|nr:alpha/beta family hydrolase [Rhizomicrobium sp.]